MIFILQLLNCRARAQLFVFAQDVAFLIAAICLLILSLATHQTFFFARTCGPPRKQVFGLLYSLGKHNLLDILLSFFFFIIFNRLSTKIGLIVREIKSYNISEVIYLCYSSKYFNFKFTKSDLWKWYFEHVNRLTVLCSGSSLAPDHHRHIQESLF